MKKLGTGAVTTGGGTRLYTVPTGYQTDVMSIDIANTTTGALTCTIHLVPSGGSVATTNMLFPATPVTANTLVQWTGLQHLNAGDFIQGIGSGVGITVHITGDERRQSV